eukprot:5176466-Pleurochrysis_carterae.AAC.3
MDTGSCDSGIEPAQVAAPLCTQNPPAVETSTSRATVELPEDILDAIVLRTGWREYFRLWRLVCRRYEKIDWFLRRRFVTVVPDTHSSLNSAISNASTIDGEKLVLVRPGVYLESVRMTREVTLVGLGSRNKVVIQVRLWHACSLVSVAYATKLLEIIPGIYQRSLRLCKSCIPRAY